MVHFPPEHHFWSALLCLIKFSGSVKLMSMEASDPSGGPQIPAHQLPGCIPARFQTLPNVPSLGSRGLTGQTDPDRMTEQNEGSRTFALWDSNHSIEEQEPLPGPPSSTLPWPPQSLPRAKAQAACPSATLALDWATQPSPEGLTYRVDQQGPRGSMPAPREAGHPSAVPSAHPPRACQGSR